MSHSHHHHHHDDGHHHHHHHIGSGTVLVIALLLTLGFAAVEAVFGWLANSLALLGDAGHMLSDAAALGLAAFAAWLAKRPPSLRHSYGLVRAEAMAAMFNGLFMLAVIASIVWAAIDRLHQPQDVAGSTVIWVALLGMAVNIVVAVVLSRGEQNLNTRGAMLHVLGDLLGSVAALISGLAIYFWGWLWMDPVLSVLICVLILLSTLRLLREVVAVMMEAVPSHIDLGKVGAEMASVTGVKSVHDLHIWTLASGQQALSAHVVLDDLRHWPDVLKAQQHLLEHHYHIDHITLQPEVAVFTLSQHSLDDYHHSRNHPH
ncbi:MAG: cation diffusion facilitator family transporter [Gammaproteobacteria bacterium]|nr:cation diffusion facilitator family transporter [Gammaproteobacteria bacterium]